MQETDIEGRRDKSAKIEERLGEYYGARPYNASAYESDLLGALIATILSQHTSDLNSGRAYASLKAAFPTGWDAVRAAPESQIADAIRCGGLADVKAARIKRLLGDICQRTRGTSLEFLREWDSERIETFLTSFHGVGAKTAACVLLFNLGRPAMPVDTHVHRVSRRLGLIGPKTDAPSAQKELMALVPAEQAYSFHVHLIEHGRAICHAQRPECGRCPISDLCDTFTSAQAGGS